MKHSLSATLVSTTVTTPGANNQILSSNASGVTITPTYDAAGNMLNDGRNQYLYDGEGRVCAVLSQPLIPSGNAVLTGYLYDAEGNRVAKGTLSTFSCNMATNGFTTTNSYVIGPNGEQLSETDGSGNWLHSNVYAAGQLIATYDQSGVHFQFSDWLGTRRVETDYAGNPEETCTNQPFGDNAPPCSSPTEHFFTAKEHDPESGNDYFGARYYTSNMGRFMSPDWSKYPAPVPYASFANPQSLNLYTYVSNNPLRFSDPNGHHQECAPDTSSTDKNGVLTVTAGACHEVPDWWQFQGVRRWIGHHPKTVKATFGVVNAATVVSGLLDGGTSELAVPEELVLEEAIEEAGELAAEEGATAAETAEAGTGGEATAESAQMKKLSNGEIKQLKDSGVDPHDLKPNSKYDLFKNKDGEIFVKPKAGNGPGEPTGLNIKDYK